MQLNLCAQTKTYFNNRREVDHAYSFDSSSSQVVANRIILLHANWPIGPENLTIRAWKND